MKAAERFGRDSIGILGAGVEGLAAIEWLRQHAPGARLTLLSNAADMSLPETSPACHVDTTAVSPDRLCEFDWLLRSPGFSPYRAPLANLADRPDAPRVISSTSLWFAEWPEARSIVVTGTKGKSTVASMIFAMLSASGIDATLAGNIGVPLLSVDPPDWTVVELSSYQLCDWQGNATIGVLTNLYPEHLDWHGGYPQYVADKLGWLARMGGRKVFMPAHAKELIVAARALAGADPQWIHVGDGKQGLRLDGRTLVVEDGKTGPRTLMGANDWPLAGEHNRSNGLLAMQVALAAGASESGGVAGLRGFKGLPHRFEVIAIHQHWRFIDDSIATTPYATLAAVRALPDAEQCILLVGGQDRGVDWSVFYQALPDLGLLALIGLHGGDGNNAGTIIACARKAQPSLNCYLAESMDEALQCTSEIIRDGTSNATHTSNPGGGGAVLLSPGAPSYGLYRDFRHRGQAFRQSVQSIMSKRL